ncbi:MAG: hypothetical protein ACPG5U_08980 [Planktomarina sp.]
MTALHKFDRLEAVGHASHGDQRWAEVIVQLGKSTLVLADTKGAPLSHWSLAGISRIQDEGTATLFDLSGAQQDLIWIDDVQMVAALGKIENAVVRTQVQPFRVTRYIVAAFAAVSVLGLTVAAIQKLPNYAASLVSDTKAQALGLQMVSQIDDLVGPLCRTPEGLSALSKMTTALSSLGDLSLHAASMGQDHIIVLPGSNMIISADLLQSTASPAALAGHIIHAQAAAVQNDPVQRVFENIGPWHTLRYLVQGNINDAARQTASNAALSEPALAVSADTLIQAFDITGISAKPFAASSLAWSQNLTAALNEKDPYAEGSLTYLLADGAFIGLQSICD